MISEKSTKQELLDEYKRLIEDAKKQKVTIPEDAKGVNSKNTKADILNAIRAIQNALLDSKTVSVSSNPAPAPPVPVTPEKNEPTKTTAPAVTKEEDIELILLKQEIKDEIAALDAAKALKKKELAELLEIEQELTKFVTMINSSKNDNLTQEQAHAEQKAKQEADAKESLETCETENQEELDDAKEALEQVKADIEEKKQALAESRAVETEQYTYDKTKKQKTEDDAWADDSAKREEAIAEIEKATADLQAEIDSKAQLVAELTAKIDEIPSLIEKAKEEGATAKEKELGKEYGYQTNMAKKQAEVDAQSLQKQIDRLTADYNAVLAEKEAIQVKLDKAYEESNKLYMQTVQSTGGVKILNSSDKN
ncbi:MAG: hypothetical protein V3G42_06600 [Oscillospiraceae bacterium]